MTDPGEAEPLPNAAPDGVPDALRGARPAGHADVSAALSRARIAARLFGATEVVRVGRYEVESRAGGGGGGEVFVARDPELSRRVAIKLMRGGGDRERMLAEGQALARLSHPNIVPVYDAGTLDDRVYVVMELVEGDTLREYCEAEARSVREIVRAYRQAAEGLAAAHRAGFIHRDFKPDNVLVGHDDRVRVVDFGLARSSGDAPQDAGGGEAPVNVSRAGLGTPRYMAPEQAARDVLTPAADQYAFCASLREGLLAHAPSVPRWLEAIFRRGMATDPAARYPSMTALHAALGRDPASRWRKRALAAGVLGVVTTAFIIGRGDRVSAPSCDTGAAEIARVWNAPVSAKVTAHLIALATPYAHVVAPHVLATLDGYATRWSAGHRDACVTHRDGAQSSALFDRRGACLARAKAALGTGVSVVNAASGVQLADAIAALRQLPDLDRCADASALATTVAPPPPTAAAAVAAVFDELASLEVEFRAARPNVRPRIDVAISKARGLGYQPLVARALRLAGVAAIAAGAYRDAVTPLAEARKLALTAGDMALAVEVFAHYLFATVTLAQDTAPANGELIEAMEAIAAGLPPSERAVRAQLDNSLGSVALEAGNRDQARAAYERALGNAREVTGSARLPLVTIWTNLASTIEDPERRIALARERVAIVESELDADHPRVLAARIFVANLESNRERAREGLEAPCTRLVDVQPDRRQEIVDCQFGLGWLALERGDSDAARRAFGHAVATEWPGVTLGLARAYLDLLAGRLSEATNQIDAAAAGLGPLEDAAWHVLYAAAEVMLARGAVARAAGRQADARAAFDAARPMLETVVKVKSVPRYARLLAFARTSLVRAWSDGRLPPAIRRHAEAAIAWYRSAGGYADVIAELERALARGA